MTLHRNPTPAWTVVSDLFLALMFVLLASGLLLVPARNGMRGIEWILLLAGVVIPLLLCWIIAA